MFTREELIRYLGENGAHLADDWLGLVLDPASEDEPRFYFLATVNNDRDPAYVVIECRVEGSEDWRRRVACARLPPRRRGTSPS